MSVSQLLFHRRQSCEFPRIPISSIFADLYRLLENDSLLDHSFSGGVYWRWWRKVMVKPEERNPTNATYSWSWKVQLNMIPTAVALHQPSRTEC